MSRRSLPRIDPSDLSRDHADEARVERIWERLEADLPEREVRAPRRFALGLSLAAAAVFAAFAGGVVAGRSYGRHDATPSARAVADAADAEVLAAGEEARVFPLPGGGRLTLSPGATVEIDRAGADLTLKLVQGDATLETSQREAAMVVGDARLNTQAGSTVTVSRRVDNLNVGVTQGSASLESPSMQEKLGSGDAVSVALHREIVSAPSHTAVARVAHAPLRHGSEPAAAEVAAAPRVAAEAPESAASDKEAAERIQHAPGGFEAAIRQAGRASEVMRLYDLAHVAKDGAAATQALKRIAEAFPNDAYAHVATHQLCSQLGETGEGSVYCERDKQSPLFDADAESCRKLAQATSEGHKDEALRMAREYLNGHTDGGGQCRDEAQHLLAVVGDASDHAPDHDGEAAHDKPAASASAAPSTDPSAPKGDVKASPPKP